MGNVATLDVSQGAGLGAKPGNSGVVANASVQQSGANGTGFLWLLEDDTGYFRLEDDSGDWELEAGPS